MRTADKLYSLEDGGGPAEVPYKAEPDADPNDVIGAAGRDPADHTVEVGAVAGRDCWIVRRRGAA